MVTLIASNYPTGGEDSLGQEPHKGERELLPTCSTACTMYDLSLESTCSNDHGWGIPASLRSRIRGHGCNLPGSQRASCLHAFSRHPFTAAESTR